MGKSTKNRILNILNKDWISKSAVRSHIGASGRRGIGNYWCFLHLKLWYVGHHGFFAFLIFLKRAIKYYLFWLHSFFGTSLNLVPGPIPHLPHPRPGPALYVGCPFRLHRKGYSLKPRIILGESIAVSHQQPTHLASWGRKALILNRGIEHPLAGRQCLLIRRLFCIQFFTH